MLLVVPAFHIKSPKLEKQDKRSHCFEKILSWWMLVWEMSVLLHTHNSGGLDGLFSSLIQRKCLKQSAHVFTTHQQNQITFSCLIIITTSSACVGMTS